MYYDFSSSRRVTASTDNDQLTDKENLKKLLFIFLKPKMATLSLLLSQNTRFLPYSSSKRRHFLSQGLLHPPIKIITCSAKRDQVDFVSSTPLKELQTVACGLLAAWAVTAASPVIAASQVKDHHLPIRISNCFFFSQILLIKLFYPL